MSVQRALDRLRFGPRRTLNVRESGLPAAEAARRVEIWLRVRQIEFHGDVLVITGRGAGSRDGIAAVRDATLRTLHALRRNGVVSRIQADTPGSFVVTLAPLRALLEAPARRKRYTEAAGPPSGGIEGISAQSRALLRELASRSLSSLGVVPTADRLISDEMDRQFSLLIRAAPPSSASEEWLETALRRVLVEYEDG